MTLPPLSRSALLLDLDGTLLDFAPTPDAVIVPPDLVPTLRALFTRLGGALAVVSGRSLTVLDELMPQSPWAMAGEHGVAIRPAQGAAIERAALPPIPEAWIEHASAMVAATPGMVMERKALGFTMHYRRAPEAGPHAHAFLRALLAEQDRFQLLAGNMVWEVRPVGIDKGHAVEVLMTRPPFLGRLPIFIGDDVTDEDGMRVARDMGGLGLRVDTAFGSPASVRAWLTAAARGDDWPEVNDALA